MLGVVARKPIVKMLLKPYITRYYVTYLFITVFIGNKFDLEIKIGMISKIS